MSAAASRASNVKPIRATRTPEVEWLSPAQVCERVPVLTVRHLRYLRSKLKGPAWHKTTERTVVYSAADVDAWVQSRRVTTRDAT